jgi:hypothetical protein
MAFCQFLRQGRESGYSPCIETTAIWDT